MRMLAFAAAGLVLAGCGPMPLEPRDPTPGVPHFTVSTFNVHFPLNGDEKTVSAIEQTGADVIFLQEVNAPWARALRERYAGRYRSLIIHEDEEARGLAVLSRFPVRDMGLLRAPHDFHPAWRVIVDSPGGPVQVLHVHLRSKFNGTSNPVSNYFATADDHVLEMKEFYASCEDLPTLVLGDFNEEPDGAAIEWLARRGFENALPLFRPGQWTWRGRSVGNQFAMTIDHILFDPSFTPLDAWVAKAGNSDHSPVVAHLEFSGSGG